MHATHLERLHGSFPLPALLIPLALGFGLAPIFAEEPAKAPEATTPAANTVAPASINAELPAPTAPSDATEQGEAKAAPYGLVFRQPEAVANRSTLAGPDSASFELSHSLPLVRKLVDVNLFSGLYEFNEETSAPMSGVRTGMDLALNDRVHLEASMNQNPDLNRRNAFVGLWASIPLREPGFPRAHQPGDAPERTLIATMGGEPTRHRTSRRPDSDGGARGLFSRLFSGVGDRLKSSPEDAAPAPLKSEPSPEDPSAESTKQEKKSGGLAHDFIQRIRR